MIHHLEIHMTGKQAGIGEGAQFVFLVVGPDGTRRIAFRHPGGNVETGFHLSHDADAHVAVARIMRRRPGLRLDPDLIHPPHHEEGEARA